MSDGAPPAPAAHELVASPDDGRIFALELRPALDDCAPSGRIRLDGLARALQDVAYADVEDAGLAAAALWVLRRTRLCVRRFPRFGERLQVRTFCSGIGPLWAERRTTIAVPGRPDSDVEAVSLWIHLDPDSRHPSPLTASELETYGRAAGGRRVKARRRHPRPEGVEHESRWRFRAVDCDLADHVNNAVYWQPLEEALLTGPEPDGIDAEVEFWTPAQPGEVRILRAGPWRWIAGSDDEVYASIALMNAATTCGSN